MNLIGICGVAGAGKDTAADVLVREFGFVKVALADPIKRMTRDAFDFSEAQLWGPSDKRNEPDHRYYRGIIRHRYPNTPSGAVWIPLPNAPGAFALIDAADFESVTKHTWRLHRKEIGRNTNYVKKTESDVDTLLHYFIVGDPTDGRVVDHINGDGLDNRRVNLRTCTKGENRRNEIKRSPDTALSAFKGVTWDTSREKWIAKITIDGRTVNLGRFSNETAAAMAYDSEAKRTWGPFARLNQDLFLTPRYALQRLGTEWARSCYPDVWVNITIRTAKALLTTQNAFYERSEGLKYTPGPHLPPNALRRGVTISDVRFPNEANAIHAVGGKIWRINRPGAGLTTGGTHISETGVDGLQVDYEIVNNGTLEQFRSAVSAVMKGGD
jgi:HNH endonuclease